MQSLFLTLMVSYIVKGLLEIYKILAMLKRKIGLKLSDKILSAKVTQQQSSIFHGLITFIPVETCAKFLSAYLFATRIYELYLFRKLSLLNHTDETKYT